MITLRTMGRLCGAALLAVGLGLDGTPALAQNFPSRAVTLVVPYAAGGTPDILSRILAEDVGHRTGQPVVVDNRGGAGGNIGGQLVAQAAPDGYTLLVCAFSCSTAPSLYSKPPYDTREMTPVAMIGTVPSVMVVPASLPVHSLQEFIALAKRQPLNYASSGIGSSPHLISELLAQRAGIELTHVPYRGAGQVAPDLMAGRVQVLFDNLPASLPNIRSGKLRALLVAQDRRAEAAPEIPTSAEAGMPELLITPWFGLFAPAGTPASVADRLNQLFNEALREPGVLARMKELGVDVAGGDRQHLASFVRDDVTKWGAIIRDRHISAD